MLFLISIYNQYSKNSTVIIIKGPLSLSILEQKHS